MVEPVREGAPGGGEVVDFLRRQPLVAELTEEELQVLASITSLHRHEAGVTLLHEHQTTEALIFIYRGTVEVLKDAYDLPDPGNLLPDEYAITRLGEGAVIGEMSFVDGERTSATVRTAGPCEVLVVPHEAIERVAVHVPSLYRKLILAVARLVVKRLRGFSEEHVGVLHSRMREALLRQQFATFFVITMALFGIASTVQKLINDGLPPLQQMLYSWGFLLLTFAPIAWFVWRLRLPWSTWGLTLRNTGKSLWEGLALGAVLAVVAVAVRVGLKPPEEAFVNWGSLANYNSIEFTVFFIAYGPHCFLQETIGRGVIQGALVRFLPESRPLVPILLTSALFGIFHLYVSLSFAAITFGASLLFGWLYHRHRTLVGVTVLHYLIGAFSVALGFN